MWVRATPNEIAENRRTELRKDWTTRILLWLAASILVSVVHFRFLSVAEFSVVLPFSMLWVGIWFLIAYPWKGEEPFLICLKCGTPKKGKRGQICSCGEECVEFVESKWMKDESDPGYPLTGNYFLIQESPHEVEIRPRANEEDAPIIPKKVIQIAWDKPYILAKRIGFTGGLPDERAVEYWILDTEGRVAHGPLDKKQFHAKHKELGFSHDLFLKDISVYTRSRAGKLSSS